MPETDLPDPPAARGHFLLGRLLVGQALAAAATAGFALAMMWLWRWTPPLLLLLMVDAALAAAIARFGFKMTLPWQIAQAALPLAAGAVSQLNVPAWVWLAAFAVLALIYWNSPGGRVPLYLTNRATYRALAELLPKERGFSFADLGSGLGGPVFALAKRRPDGAFTGFETAPLPYLISKLRGLFSRRPNASIAFADYRKRDLAPFDVVYCFLSPAPMPELYRKARREMRAGSLLISNSFFVPGHRADRTLEVDDRRGTILYVWEMPGGAA